MMSQKNVQLSAAVVAMMIANVAYAQKPNRPNNPVRPIVGGVGGVVVQTHAGDYNFKNFDQTAGMKQMVDLIAARSQADLQYFKESIAYLNTAFQNVVQKDVYGKGDANLNGAGLKTLSDASALQARTVSVDVFVDALNRYDQDKRSLQSSIAKIASIAEAFPSQVAVKADGTVNTSIPSYGQVRFDSVVKYYNDELAKMDAFLSNLPHKIIPATGIPVIVAANSGEGLAPAIPAFQVSATEILNKKMEILEKRKWSRTSWDRSMVPYTTEIKRMVQEFIKVYGSEERYRYDAGTPKKMQDELTKFIDYFYARSYFRAIYGMPLGGIGIIYEVKKFNTDFFFSSNNIRIVEEVLTRERDYVAVEKAYMNAMNAATTRTKEVFGKDVNFLDRVSSAFTFLKGQNRLAVANRMMFDLLYKDFQEERLIMTQGGAAMRDAYRARYKSTKDQAAYFDKLKARYDAICQNDIGDKSSEDPWSSAGMTMSGGSVMAAFQKVLAEAQAKEADLAMADELEKSLQMMMKVAERRQNNRAARAKDL